MDDKFKYETQNYKIWRKKITTGNLLDVGTTWQKFSQKHDPQDKSIH